ncbi:hypothetical protein [Leuconostoc gelidum]|uniref:Uncharacterized protein n=1 Tax=Leuconostoc gelidum subsp. gelidum TaxID=1607839 RepID=A0AB35FX55_LEUGE|nr:hypothetical protein [Leuconostoc gelidum]MBZ5985919.1 hypothetical protein [Leuconostoc gelidum subsp. gelidum]MBZ6014965.1 hypothetical protein [Leuconostoc gelidum subsp. gelidum]
MPMFINTLKYFGMAQSVIRISTPVDHTQIENFCYILKANIVHEKQYESFHDFKIVVAASIITTIDTSSNNSIVCHQ